MSYYSILNGIKKDLREESHIEIKNGKSKNFITLHFSERSINELIWMEKDEFSFHGVNFDVIKIEKVNGSIKILAFADAKETDFFSRIRKVGASDTNKGTGKGTVTFVKILNLKYLDSFSSEIKIAQHSLLDNLKRSDIISYPTDYPGEILHPPSI